MAGLLVLALQLQGSFAVGVLFYTPVFPFLGSLVGVEDGQLEGTEGLSSSSGRSGDQIVGKKAAAR